eukprot:m.190913 g.190913  ORF g.190913 m.190913 type:complete len:133 (+) comp39438_c0_seq17:113-511(+)
MFDVAEWTEESGMPSEVDNSSLFRQFDIKKRREKKKRGKKRSSVVSNDEMASSHEKEALSPLPASAPKKSKVDIATKASKIASKVQKKLEEGRFRWINERLYTTTSDEAYGIFSNTSLFEVYHRGFQTQAQK